MQRPSDVRFPLIVKPLDEDASVGIAQRSVVHDDAALAERISFIHARHNTDAIVEEFIAGRELYIGVTGNDPPRALPPIEMVFAQDSAEFGVDQRPPAYRWMRLGDDGGLDTGIEWVDADD